MIRLLVKTFQKIIRTAIKYKAVYIALIFCVFLLFSADSRHSHGIEFRLSLNKGSQVVKNVAPSHAIEEHVRTYSSEPTQKVDILKTLHVPYTYNKQHSENRNPKEDLTVLTMFTTFKNSTKRNIIESNTIKNWASLLPNVQPVLYADSQEGELVALAKSHGWKVHKIQKKNTMGTPVLKDMFLQTFANYKSHFIGFCNGDILFDDALVTTLRGLVRYFDYLNTTLVIGRRTNYYLKKNLTQDSLLYKKDVVRFVSHYSSIFTRDAEDYFFLSSYGFPWNKLKDVVIGRPGYDNYFVGLARKNHVSVVDATQTILALHQTGQEGKRAGAHNKDSHYNKNLIGAFNYEKGSTNFAHFETHHDALKDIFISKRILSKKRNYQIPEDIDKFQLESLQNSMHLKAQNRKLRKRNKTHRNGTLGKLQVSTS